MVLRKAKLRNWCQHRSLDCEFHPGLTGILGSNGNGKSNFLDALRFCFAAQSINGGNNRDNLTWGQTSGSVECEFDVGDTVYELHRSVESSKCHLRFGDTRLSKSGEIEDYLVALYDAPMKMMLDNVFIGQGKIDQILSARPGDRLKEFQASFGLDRAQDAYRLLGTEANSCQVTPGLQETLQEMVQLVQAARERVAGLEGKSKELTAKVDQLAVYEDVLARALEALRMSGAVKQADEQVGRADIAASVATQKFEQTKAQATTERARVEQARGRAETATQQLVHMEAEHAQYVRSQVARQSLATQQEELARLPKPPHDLAESRQTLGQARATRDQLTGMINTPGSRPKLQAHKDLEDKLLCRKMDLKNLAVTSLTLPPEVTSLKAELDTRKRELDALGNGICYACGQPVHGGPDEAATKHKEYAELQSRLDCQVKAFADKHTQEAEALRVLISQIEREIKQHEDAGFRVLTTQLQEAVTLVSTLESAIFGGDTAQMAINDKLSTIRTLQAVIDDRPGAPLDETLKVSLQGIIDSFANACRETEKLENSLIHLENIATSAQGQARDAHKFRADLGQVAALPSEAEMVEARLKVAERAQARHDLEALSTELGVAKGLCGQREQEAQRLLDKSRSESDQAAWLEVVTQVREALHVTKYPAQAMREYATILNQHLEIYLNLLEAPFKCWLDDSMEFQVLFTAGPKKGYQLPAYRLSGGERILASTSFRLAMADTFARKMGLLVLDEPSAYLDGANIQHLQVLLLKLREISRTKGRQILIVTHEDQLKGFLDHVITI